MRILKYGIFCILVLAASIMIRRPAHVEKAQTQPQVPESTALPALTANALKGDGGGSSSPPATGLQKAETQQPSPWVTKPFDDDSGAGHPDSDRTESPFTMTKESAPLGPIFGPGADDEELPFDRDGNFFPPEAELQMTETWKTTPLESNPFGDDAEVPFGEDDGSGFFSDDSSFEAFSNKGSGNEEQE